MIETAARAIEADGDARTAPKALRVLSENMDQIKGVVVDRRKRSEAEDFTFTYEEEADPEIFFVPYVWEIVVCVVTSSSVEWNKHQIQVFPLLDEEPMEENGAAETVPIPVGEYSKDVSDVV